MEGKVIFYIILGIGYFLWNVFFKKRPEKKENRPTQRTDSGNGEMPKSLEDLLKTLGQDPEEYKEQKKEVSVEPEPTQVEYQPIYDDEVQEDYEKPEALEKILKTHTVNLEGVDKASVYQSIEPVRRSENYRKKKKKRSKYAKLLSQKDSSKDAIILAEILNKKF